jgi:hypothetical protein
MFGAYLRFALFIAGLVGAVILFAFAFTAAAIVVVITVLLLLIFGKKNQVRWDFVRRTGAQQTERPPLIIDHDPNDLPPR